MPSKSASDVLSQIGKDMRFDESTGRFFWKTRKQGRKLSMPAGGINQDGYRQLFVGGYPVLEHRLVWLFKTGDWPVGEIDHVNGDVLDNRFCNLRDVSRSVNQQNQRKSHRDSLTGLLGSRPTENGSFRAEIQVNGVKKSLGRYSTAEEAHAVYLAAKREMHEGCTI